LNGDFEETPMSGDELDRTIEFLLQNAARSAARSEALHEQNMLEHAKLSQEQAAFQLQLRELGDHVTVMTETLTATLTAMNERDARQDRRLAKFDSRLNRVDSRFNRVEARFDRVESLIEQIAKLVHSHVSDPRAHRPDAG
jgi:nitrate reductase assembly molybdenum cofactor insertion protein NarJ